ncbi:unnamed protein product [Effrenium voratum]|nr:unnamed protein product [Effrenium voratum]
MRQVQGSPEGGLPVNDSRVVSDCDGVRTGEVCHQHCAVGYENITEETDFTCRSDGYASGSQTQCQPIPCNGTTMFDRILHTCAGGLNFPGSCYASCSAGYTASPEQWLCGDETMGPELGFEVYKGITIRGLLPNCTAVPCAFNLPVGPQYFHDCQGVLTGASCTVGCAEGWEGPSEVLTCSTSGALQGTFPLCSFITSTRTSTTSSTRTSSKTATVTLDVTTTSSTRSSSSTTWRPEACPEELPEVAQAGDFDCNGTAGAGQVCYADCQGGDHLATNSTAVIICRYDFQWELATPCPSFAVDPEASLPILLYVGLTVGSCVGCMMCIGVLAYIARRKPSPVSPEFKHKAAKASPKMAFEEKAEPQSPTSPEPVKEQVVNIAEPEVQEAPEQPEELPPRKRPASKPQTPPQLPTAVLQPRSEVPPPPPVPKKFNHKDMDIQRHAAGLGGTPEPQSSIVLASPTANEYDPDFWDWANQFWDWANQLPERQNQAPPPPMLPGGVNEAPLRILAGGEGPPPLPPLPATLSTKARSGSPPVKMLEEATPSGSPPMKMLQEDPPETLALPSMVEEPQLPQPLVSNSQLLEGLLFNPELHGQPKRRPQRQQQVELPTARTARRGRRDIPPAPNQARVEVSPTQERRLSRAAASLHEGAAMSELEIFRLRSGPAPALPPMEPAGFMARPRQPPPLPVGPPELDVQMNQAPRWQTRQAQRDEVIVNVSDEPRGT